ncbi:hypothetical protein GVN21_11960 [Caulobacter sp. SLTY]|uniref:hypothetical protein n=1 Tax=Caulobacter sp. SLTY TaxID=2683262 RepID=UPI0014122C5A|nr:hypothetical protein [Caulobacter sp. SLTY]NBB16073.1 hypothetical protein [Caulobacter sp. SLTY]
MHLRFSALCLAALLPLMAPSVAQAQDTARQQIQKALRDRGFSNSQIANNVNFDDESRWLDNSGFQGLQLSMSVASASDFGMTLIGIRNTTSIPYCVRPLLVFQPAHLVTGKVDFNMVVEPYSFGVILAANGKTGQNFQWGAGVAYWPARTDVTQGRCSTIQPDGLNQWLAAGQPTPFWNNRR